MPITFRNTELVKEHGGFNQAQWLREGGEKGPGCRDTSILLFSEAASATNLTFSLPLHFPLPSYTFLEHLASTKCFILSPCGFTAANSLFTTRGMHCCYCCFPATAATYSNHGGTSRLTCNHLMIGPVGLCDRDPTGL